MYPYLQYTKVYTKVQARSRLQLELFGTDPFEGTRDVQRGCTRIFVASRDSNLDISGCQGRDRGPLPNSFHHLRKFRGKHRESWWKYREILSAEGG